jgi:hypothetical protein
MKSANGLVLILLFSLIFVCDKSFAEPQGVNIVQPGDTYYACIHRCQSQMPPQTVFFYSSNPPACYCKPVETGRPLDAFSPTLPLSTPVPSITPFAMAVSMPTFAPSTILAPVNLPKP